MAPTSGFAPPRTSPPEADGAIGFTKERTLQLYTRRAKVQELSYGDANFHKEVALQKLETS